MQSDDADHSDKPGSAAQQRPALQLLPRSWRPLPAAPEHCSAPGSHAGSDGGQHAAPSMHMVDAFKRGDQHLVSGDLAQGGACYHSACTGLSRPAAEHGTAMPLALAVRLAQAAQCLALLYKHTRASGDHIEHDDLNARTLQVTVQLSACLSSLVLHLDAYSQQAGVCHAVLADLLLGEKLALHRACEAPGMKLVPHTLPPRPVVASAVMMPRLRPMSSAFDRGDDDSRQDEIRQKTKQLWMEHWRMPIIG